MNRKIVLSMLLLLALAGSSLASFPSPGNWRNEVIYFLLVDRFANGDTSNDRLNGEYDPSNMLKVHGGDLRGVINKLDYIQSVGATAIWLSPVMKTDGLYSGYAVQDYYSVEPRYGTMETLRELVQKAHAKGMRVILDIQVNHSARLFQTYDCNTGRPADWFIPPAQVAQTGGYCMRYLDESRKHVPEIFRNPALFHNNGRMRDYNDPFQRFLAEFPTVNGDADIGGYNDFRTDLPVVRQALLDIYKYWIREADIDGFRVDAIKHAEVDFFRSFIPGILDYAASLGKTNFLAYGEAFDGNDAVIGEYSGRKEDRKAGKPHGFLSMIDFPGHFNFHDVFSWGKPTRILEDRYNRLFSGQYYDRAIVDDFVTFVDNHDLPRMMHETKGDRRQVMAALALQFGATGIPQIYYGIEQEYTGGETPFCHEDLWSSGYRQDTAVYRHIKQLSDVRKGLAPLRLGGTVSRWVDYAGPGIFVMSRIYNGEEVLVAVNSSNRVVRSEWNGIGATTTMPAGTVLRNQLPPYDEVVVGRGTAKPEQVFLELQPYGYGIYTR